MVCSVAEPCGWSAGGERRARLPAAARQSGVLNTRLPRSAARPSVSTGPTGAHGRTGGVERGHGELTETAERTGPQRGGAVRVLGVDPGLTRCGVGVVEGSAGRPLRMAAVGVVRTPSESGIAERLVLIERGMEEWLDAHQPEAVAVERVFSQHNVRTVMGTAQASAVAMLCASRRGLPVALHTPSEVKAAVTGTGRAGKEQVGAMVTRLLRLEAAPKPADAADALALAICHIWRAPALSRLQRARSAAPSAPSPPGGRAASGGSPSGAPSIPAADREQPPAAPPEPPSSRPSPSSPSSASSASSPSSAPRARKGPRR